MGHGVTYKKILLPVLIMIVYAIETMSVCADDLAFFELVRTGTPQQIQSAIRSGADVNARDMSGWTPLIWAASSNTNPEVIITLLDNGADGKVNSMGKTAFNLEKKYKYIKRTDAYKRLKQAEYKGLFKL
jgi:hypothetical protein